MAQAIVQMSCTKLRSAIAIGDEATGDLQEMLEALEVIQPMLEDAERRWLWSENSPWSPVISSVDHPLAETELVPKWLSRVTNNAYNISDMVDDLEDTRRTSRAAGKMTRMIPRRANAPKENPMAGKMKEMKEELNKLRVELAGLNLMPSDSDPSVEPIIDVSDVEEAIIVGRDELIQRIMAKISASNTSEGPIIVKISGENGCGKTALAQMVFNHTRFKHYSRVWIHGGSWKSSLHEIGKSIISQVSGEEINSGSNDMEYITRHLHQLLNGTKVLVAIDNLHLEGIDPIQFKRMLTGKGSKVIVIITTGNLGFYYSGRNLGFDCDLLSDDMCWTIIKQRSRFEDRSESDKQDLEQIGRVIASTCGGLPLAAASVGGTLRYKDATGWKETVNSDFLTECELLPFLFLAYTSMPPSLKLCFAYCGMFRKGQCIAKDDLIHQWIALGLLEQSDRFSSTQLGDRHIRMLVGMSLLQTTKSALISANDDKGTTNLFTMSDVVLDLAAKIYIMHGTMDPSSWEDCRDCRYALVTDLNLSSTLPSQLRALRCVGCSEMELGDDSFSFPRCLRMLDLNDRFMQKLPDSICQLRHLGYLNLSGCSGLVTLPESVGDLLNLLYIYLSGCSGLVNLPESFGKLLNLVHIYLSGCSGLVNLPESFGKLTNLLHIDLSRCSRLVNLPDSFEKLTNLKHVDLSGCFGLEKLPQSFGKLINLVHINLSECSGLVNLPPSFGKLTHVQHIDLSGCSRLAYLPESFGKLINLEHINLSGCSRLLNLPRSFGNLINLLRIDLSCCHELAKLPESLGKLKKLVHLDLSFWSCFEGIEKALGGLTNLLHLNLSHPCCYLAQHQSHLEGLKHVLGQLTNLRYLNLSMFLNPVFYSQSVEKTREFIDCIGSLSSLEHLDLSHNMFLRDLPESLCDLYNLHTLDLSGCIRLQRVVKRICEMKSLKSIIVRNCRVLKSYQFVVHADDGGAYSSSNLFELEDVDLEELEISCLEEVKPVIEVRAIRLVEKRKLRKLKLCWTVGSQGSVLDNDLLGHLVPPHNLRCLELHGYNGETCYSAWWTRSICSNLRNLLEVTIEDSPRCSRPPPLALLPNLQRVVLRRMASMTSFDVKDLTGGNRAAFDRLSNFTLELDDMENLEEFKTTYYRGGTESMFPAIGELVILKCPKLFFVPLPLRARRFVISDCCTVLMASRWNGEQRFVTVEVPCTSAPVTELVVKSCKLNLCDWNLLHYLPGLHSLTVENCDLLTTALLTVWALSSLQSLCFSHCGEMHYIPDAFQRLTSLRLMHLSDCNGITSLPEWLGDLTSLERLAIERCSRMASLPQSIQRLTNLKDLQISGCPRLKEWCESKENKAMIAHIRLKYGEHGTSRPTGDVEEDCSDNVEEAWTDRSFYGLHHWSDDVEETVGDAGEVADAVQEEEAVCDMEEAADAIQEEAAADAVEKEAVGDVEAAADAIQEEEVAVEKEEAVGDVEAAADAIQEEEVAVEKEEVVGDAEEEVVDDIVEEEEAVGDVEEEAADAVQETATADAVEKEEAMGDVEAAADAIQEEEVAVEKEEAVGNVEAAADAIQEEEVTVEKEEAVGDVEDGADDTVEEEEAVGDVEEEAADAVQEEEAVGDVEEAADDVEEEVAGDAEEATVHQPQGSVCLELRLGIGSVQN